MSYVQHQNLYQNNAHQQATYTGVKIWVCGRVCILYHDILLHIFFSSSGRKEIFTETTSENHELHPSGNNFSSIVPNTWTGWLEWTLHIFFGLLHFLSGFVNCRWGCKEIHTKTTPGKSKLHPAGFTFSSIVSNTWAGWLEWTLHIFLGLLLFVVKIAVW